MCVCCALPFLPCTSAPAHSQASPAAPLSGPGGVKIQSRAWPRAPSPRTAENRPAGLKHMARPPGPALPGGCHRTGRTHTHLVNISNEPYSHALQKCPFRFKCKNIRYELAWKQVNLAAWAERDFHFIIFLTLVISLIMTEICVCAQIIMGLVAHAQL